MKTNRITISYSIAVQKLTETKNMQSHRIIAITEQFSKLLHDNSDYLPLYSHYYNRQFSRRLKDILDALDIPHLRFHDLRHSHASFLLYNDVSSIDYVSKRLDHKNTRITLDMYAHMLKEYMLKEKETEQSTMALKLLSSSRQMSPESKNNA
ncbi:tyrosine-type recombinase/integrase [Leuconostoc gelidum]|uniref:Tyrosine-type recombinase/integrase n=1 Tax=Leuconostoc gelidum subsp. gelidum TaxID=1607839 RepID=A0AB35FWR1_LEUGE|nr:tyrosine-type recombinase/integrase [Leuconostoc gelidum]MBZ5991193.1 tyrosine-type recombinase/integrase [Leuconostoc gelidum subsp. gelidum]MBZ6001441.1 tyrosine-type recombinase/integrase [Leuconostoc gelidum subsp. gelidum]MBZ6015071.1 tyrosine-type recombinase/integrase [Leuconostoc gelidum subsp. gelidum]USP18174.1 tyrosine-type recombinase/integrase [Leuconostoc gelidum subsp. aenigmaticum]